MKEDYKKIKYLKNLFKKDVYHIFFLVNPVVEIIIFLWIKLFNINSSNIIIFKLRRNSSELIKLPTTFFKKTILDRFFFKFGYDRNSRKYENFVKKKSIKFYLYSSWVHPEFYFLLKNNNCLGHFYFEEGQLSHKKCKFIYDNKLHIRNLRKKNKYAADQESYFRSDFINCVSIDPIAFSKIDEKKRILLNDFELLKEIYKPLLLGYKCIGLGPAPRRLKKQKLIDSLIKLANYMPTNSIIKLHPGFELNRGQIDYLKKIIKIETKKKIEFAPQNTILEIEMLFEKKYFYGAQTSLKRYASLFNSEFKLVDLY